VPRLLLVGAAGPYPVLLSRQATRLGLQRESTSGAVGRGWQADAIAHNLTRLPPFLSQNNRNSTASSSTYYPPATPAAPPAAAAPEPPELFLLSRLYSVVARLESRPGVRDLPSRASSRLCQAKGIMCRPPDMTPAAADGLVYEDAYDLESEADVDASSLAGYGAQVLGKRDTSDEARLLEALRCVDVPCSCSS